MIEKRSVACQRVREPVTPLGIDHAPSKLPLLSRRPGVSGLAALVDDLGLCAFEIDAEGIAVPIQKIL